MAYHDETGEYIGFIPELDEEDAQALSEANRLEQAQIHLGKNRFIQHQQGAFTNGIQQALNEFGVTPQQFETLAANNPNATAAVNQTSGYMTGKSIIEGSLAAAGQRPRDSQGRFTSGPPRAGKQNRKSLNQFREQVAEKGKISGDSSEAMDVL